ncbi:MAG: hypothetical protein ABL993_00885 [Vicinamibacterales bacterium]
MAWDGARTGKWFLRRGKLVRKPRSLRLTPKTDAANVPPYLPRSAAATTVGLDDGDSWWAGARQCFVGIATVGAALALGTSVAIAGSFNKQDELPAPEVQATADSGSIASNQRKAETTSFQRWYAQDELPSHAFEDDSWAAPALGKTVPAALTVWASDELGTPPATFVHEDEGWVVTLPAVKPVVTVFDQPDELPTPVTATEGGDGELSGRRAQHQTNYLRWWQTDELQPSQTFEDDFWQAPAPSKITLATLALWEGDDLPSHAFEDDSWSGQAPPNAAPQKFSLWDDGDFVTPASALGVDDEPWLVLQSRVVPPVTRLWAENDEIVPQGPTLTVVEDDGPPLLRNNDEALFTVWAENEEIVPQPAPLGIDDEPWLVLQSRVVPPVTLVFSEGDELPTPVVAASDNAGNFSQRAQQKTSFQRWYANDEIVPQGPVLTVVEDDGPELLRNNDASLFTVWAENEEIVPQPAPLGIDDEPWLVLQSRVVPPVTRIWAENDEIVPGPTGAPVFLYDPFPGAIKKKRKKREEYNVPLVVVTAATSHTQPVQIISQEIVGAAIQATSTVRQTITLALINQRKQTRQRQQREEEELLLLD